MRPVGKRGCNQVLVTAFNHKGLVSSAEQSDVVGGLNRIPKHTHLSGDPGYGVQVEQSYAMVIRQRRREG